MYNQLLELNYGEIANKQRTIVNLFPSFRDRVGRVKNNGGVTLVSYKQDLWTFKVASGDEQRHAQGVDYQVRVYFAEVENAIQSGSKHRGNWTKDGKHLNLAKLGEWVIMHADLALSCTCQASQFWGPNYQRTVAGAELDHDEQRPPVVRNPRQYGINCKHVQVIFDVLPFYNGTMAKELRQYYRDFILNLEAESVKKRFKAPASAPASVPKEEPKQDLKKLSPAQDQQEEEFRRGGPKEDDEEQVGEQEDDNT